MSTTPIFDAVRRWRPDVELRGLGQVRATRLVPADDPRPIAVRYTGHGLGHHYRADLVRQPAREAPHPSDRPDPRVGRQPNTRSIP